MRQVLCRWFGAACPLDFEQRLPQLREVIEAQQKLDIIEQRLYLIAKEKQLDMVVQKHYGPHTADIDH